MLMAMQMLSGFRLLPCRGSQLEILALSLHGLAAALLLVMGMAVPVSAIFMVMTVAPTVAMAALCKRIAVRAFTVVVAVPALRVGMTMPVGQVVAVLLLSADAHVHMRPPNAALLRRGCRDLQARDAQRVHIPQKLLPGPRLQQLVKRGHEHISRRAHIAL